MANGLICQDTELTDVVELPFEDTTFMLRPGGIMII